MHAMKRGWLAVAWTMGGWAGCDCGGPQQAPDALVVPRDAAPRDDAAVEDSGVSGGVQDPSRCRVESGDIFELGRDTDMTSRSRIIAVAGGPSEFGVAWRQAVGGFAQIQFARIPSTRGAPGVGMPATEGNVVHDQPALVATSAGYLLAWRQNSDAEFDVFARPIAATPGAIQQITDAAGLEESPSLVSTGSGYLVAWVAPDAGQRVPFVRPISERGMTTGTIQSIMAMGDVGRPTMAPIAGGAALAFTQTTGSGATRRSDVVLQPVTSTGAATGTRQQLSMRGTATGDVDLGLTAADGMAVFGTQNEGIRDVHVRRLSGSGVPSVTEYSLLDALEAGDSASVARLRQAQGWSSGCRDGYAIAYRSDAGSGPRLRLRLLDAGAQEVRSIDLDIADVASEGGQTTIRLSSDGQILLAWTDARTDHVAMRAARVRCD